jgi:hypothetical protein
LALLVAGCRVENHGAKDDDVDIATPFGGLSVKTNDAAVQQGVGLAVYPGATLVKREKGDDSAADVNLSFGDFHLGVKALTYTTPDAENKVLAFYRKDLARYGTVIQCYGHEPVGNPVRTPEGLTCAEDEGHAKVKYEESDAADRQELKAGSKYRQHIVSVEPRAGATRLTLVALELPEHLKDLQKRDADEKQ